MNKKIVLLFTVLAFQTLFLVGLFSDLFLTKHDVELNYQEIQETCLKNKNTYCKYSINIKDLDKDELKKIEKLKIYVDVVQYPVFINVLRMILLGFNFCLLFFILYRQRKSPKEDENYNFWLLTLFALGASYKFIYLFSKNITSIPFELFILILFLSCLLFYAFYFVSYLLFKNKTSAICLSLFVVGILINSINLYPLDDVFISNYFHLDTCLLVGVVVFAISLFALINFNKVLIFAKNFIICLLILCIFNGIFNLFNETDFRFINKQPYKEKYSLKDTSFNKNIYLILLDMHTGDTALKYLGYDNKNFWQELEKEGFMLKKDFSSNYNRTTAAISSLFNLNYIDTLDSDNCAHAIRKSLFFDILKEKEYKIFYRNAHADKIKLLARDVDYLALDNKFSKNNSIRFFLENTLYQNTLLKKIENKSSLKAYKSNEFFNLVFSKDCKKFVFAHFLMPHFPYLYDENGENLGSHWDFKYDNYEEVNKKSYISYLKYADKVALKIIKDIKAHDPNSVIIIIGDHGPRVKAFSDGENNHMSEFKANKMIPFVPFNVFLAYYNPDSDKKMYKDTKSLVNFMRTFVNENFGGDFKQIKDKRFFLYTNSPGVKLKEIIGMYLDEE